MFVDINKEYIYKKCIHCTYASFLVAIAPDPNYGWVYQVCNCPIDLGCKPSYESYEFGQFSLF